ncbi:DUF6314 family protein [uncultured Tateyamaria sp.]|uniref:DUF6314 family protein n=1 Tax=uncultured Tateyamaria sp. TaxID=455651 RepID=UPI00260CA179|nr:DUF6314 family protein [uncultured Tateyamaria sp.]
MPTDRLLADFEGVWTIARTITPKAGAAAQFDGTARWTGGRDRSDYTETGTLRMDGTAPMQAERRYLWLADLSVFFDDGRFFHKVPAAGGRTQHFCDPDTYTGTYDFADWPVFRVTWDVRGPRKEYRMTSVFTRLEGP